VTVTATDPGGLSATARFEVTVLNRPPEFREDLIPRVSLSGWEARYARISLQDSMLAVVAVEGGGASDEFPQAYREFREKKSNWLQVDGLAALPLHPPLDLTHVLDTTGACPGREAASAMFSLAGRGWRHGTGLAEWSVCSAQSATVSLLP